MDIVLKANPRRYRYIKYYIASILIFVLIFFIHPYVFHPSISLITLLSSILLTIYAEIDRKCTVYILTNIEIKIEKGILLKKIETIPLKNVVKIDVKKSVIGRLLKYGNILIYTAKDNKYILEYIRDPDYWNTEIMRRTMLKLPPPPVPIPVCPVCGEKLIWIEKKKKWYCRKCRKYR